MFTQSPVAAALLLPGQKVRFKWSDGPPPVQVPDVHGRVPGREGRADGSQAPRRHMQAGLRRHGACRPGHRNPAPFGSPSRPQGTAVTIQVSKGPELVKVPDVRGDKVNDAIKELNRLGFHAAVPNYNSKGHVFEQSPKPGRMIPKGSTITLLL